MQDSAPESTALQQVMAALAAALLEVASTLQHSVPANEHGLWHKAAHEYIRAALSVALMQRALRGCPQGQQVSGDSTVPHRNAMVQLIALDRGAPVALRAAAISAMHASACVAALDALGRASSGSHGAEIAALCDGAEPWTLQSMATGAARGERPYEVAMVAKATFVTACLACQPTQSPALTLPLVLLPADFAECVSGASADQARSSAAALRLFYLVFDTADSANAPQAADCLKRWLWRNQPWSMLEENPPTMQHFVCALALSMRIVSAEGRTCVQPHGALLQLALEHCNASELPSCSDLVTLAASLEHRAPAGALCTAQGAQPQDTATLQDQAAAGSAGVGGVLLAELRRMTMECAPPAFRWHAVAILAAWWLQVRSIGGNYINL